MHAIVGCLLVCSSAAAYCFDTLVVDPLQRRLTGPLLEPGLPREECNGTAAI